MQTKKIFKLLFILVFWILFPTFSFWSWSWKYYQVYQNKWISNKTSIFNWIYNDNLSSSYYIDNWNLISWSPDNILRKNWDIRVIIQENWDFNVLSWFSITQYRWNSTYFTATYQWVNFAWQICSTFSNNKLISVYRNWDYFYKDITVSWKTKSIQIAKVSSGVKILQKDSKNNWILWYRLVYYTRYKRDTLKPSVTIGSITDADWNNYGTNITNWVNHSVIVKLKCKDNPSLFAGHAWCKKSYQKITVNNHILNSEWLAYTFHDLAKWWDGNWNVAVWKVNITIPIDKSAPYLQGNRIILNWKNDISSGINYFLGKDTNSYSILADKYKLWFIIKDDWVDCSDSECRWISWIKKINIQLDWNTISSCSRTYSDYNPNRGLIEEDKKWVICNLDLTNVWDSWNRNRTLKLYVEDWAWNIFEKTWTLHVKPNKPILNNIVMSCLSWCISDIYSTNEDTSNYYKYKIRIKDRWWNLVKKTVKSFNLTKPWSYIDKDTYDRNNIDDGNAIVKFDQNLWLWIINFKLRSIVPWVFNKKFIIKTQAFNNKWNNIHSTWTFTKDFGVKKYISPIQIDKTKDIKIYDTGWNIVPTTGLFPGIEYTIKIPIKNYWFDDLNYSYNIWNINTDTFVAYPTNLYKTVSVNDIQWDIKNNGSNYPGILSFKFKYVYKAWHVVDKTVYFKFNPSVTLTSNSNTWKFPLYSWSKTIWTGKDFSFKFSIVWFKSAYGQSFAIWQWKKQFNVVPYKIKSKIRQNAYNYVNSLKKDIPTNWVLIKEWNYKLDSTEYNKLKTNGINTLIVKNWNLTISTNITKRLDIAVVIDNPNYEITNSTINNYLSKGNIIIEPNVSFIDGLLFADKSILVGRNWTIFSSKTPQRVLLSKKQLLIYGTVISKNTIWGSILWTDNKYTLPWGKKTSSLYLASLFDLAFFRFSNNLYNSEPNSKYNAWKDDYCIIRYNPSFKFNPWKLLK